MESRLRTDSGSSIAARSNTAVETDITVIESSTALAAFMRSGATRRGCAEQLHPGEVAGDRLTPAGDNPPGKDRRFALFEHEFGCRRVDVRRHGIE